LGSKTVTTAGTAVPLSATALPANAVVIQAKVGNSGKVYVGDSTVSASKGHALAAGEAFILNALESPKGFDEYLLNDLYIDADTNGEGVVVQYLVRRT
jgi:hypothetical protein